MPNLGVSPAQEVWVPYQQLRSRTEDDSFSVNCPEGISRKTLNRPSVPRSGGFRGARQGPHRLSNVQGLPAFLRDPPNLRRKRAVQSPGAGPLTWGQRSAQVLEVRIPEGTPRRRGPISRGSGACTAVSKWRRPGFSRLERGRLPLPRLATSVGGVTSAHAQRFLSVRLRPPTLRSAHAVSCFGFLVSVINQKVFKCLGLGFMFNPHPRLC